MKSVRYIVSGFILACVMWNPSLSPAAGSAGHELSAVHLKADSSRAPLGIAAAGPKLEAKPWRIGLAPSHITCPPDELFAQPQDWAEVASSIRIFKYYGVQLRETGWAKRISPKAIADFANKRHIALACEFGSFSYGKERPAQIAYKNAVAELQPIFDAGGTVSYISLDGPDARLLKGKCRNPEAMDLPQLAEEIAFFYKLVREKYPAIKIGMICNYPNWDFDAGHPGMLGGDTRVTGVTVQQWFDALRAALEKLNERMDYIEIDNPYGYFVATRTHFTKKPMDGAANLLAIQDYCRKYRIPFWLVVNSEPKGPNAFEVNTLDYISRARQAGIHPDVFMIQSWYRQPAENLPQSKPDTFMHAAGMIIRRIQELYPTPAPESKPEPAPKTVNALRPSSITWGGYCHNEQLIGSEKQWEFVQKYMDGFVMHGMYWIKKRDNAGLVADEVWLETLRALGRSLQKYGKTAHIETGHGENEFDYKYDDPEKRDAVTQAHKVVDNLKTFLKEGVTISKVRDDWFPIAAATVYAETFKTTSAKDLLAMVTGADKYWGTVPGFDPARGNWREYVRIIHEAFPDIEFGFDQAPCNFYKVEPDPAIRALVPWQGLGYGYSSKGLRTLYKKREILVDGKPVPLNLDFADLMMSVALSTREAGINFYGFEGDTPYGYVTDNRGRMGKDLLPFLLAIERMQHKYGFHSSKIVNDSPKTADSDGFTIDLGKNTLVDRAVIHWGPGFARKYNWEGSSDNRAWTKLVDVANGQGGVDAQEFKAQTVHWIRCNANVRGTADGYSISEVEIFGPAHPGENLALKKNAIAKSVMPKEGHTDMSAYAPKGGPAPQLVDGDPATSWTSDHVTNDMWDTYFHDRTLAYLETYQAAGGRADQYIAESWYAGPYTLFPETRPGTFSNLAKDLIRRLRGINDDGTPMVVDLAIRKKGAATFTGDGIAESAPSVNQTVTVSSKAGTPVVLEARIRNDAKELNKGDARCLPLIRCLQAGGAENGVICRDSDGRDITAQMSCTGEYDGWFVGGIEPGQIRSFSVEITPSVKNTHLVLTFELYWNAQDPSLKPRDVFTVKME